MISVGSRDGRKGLGLGFGAAGSEMEEPELEEGEACSYHNDDYSTIDPDVALSYIDVKIQDVLGHFQKDFEGGVSAENLGAKFGGYGSFLPTYQRSPVLSHPRTPAKFHHSNSPRSPNNLHPEGGRHNTIVPSSASLLVRHGQASETTASLPLLRAPVNDTVKRDVGVLFSHCAEESTPGSELGKNCAQPSDQKSLKVRIKVGSDNLLTRNNAEIYSGLGLDISPASSLDDIHSDSEGFPLEPQDGLDESPTSILQIMTSFPVHGNLLLSPLSDDLFYLTEKEKSLGDNKPSFLLKGGKESSNVPDSGRSEDKVLGGKKPRSLEKNAHSVVLKNLNDKDTQNGTGIVLKKEIDTESLDCEELVASTLKLPLLSNSYSNVLESTKGTARGVDDSRVADKMKEESLEAVSTQEISLFQKPGGKTVSASKVWEDKKADFNGEILACPRKDGNIRGGKADVSAKADSSVSKGRKAQNAEPVDPLEQKASKKSTSSEEDDMQLPSGKENSSSGGKLKSKGSQSHDAQGAEVPKDSSRMDSSFVPKNRKSTHSNYYLCKSEMEDSKLQKDNGKAINRYKDFFGDIELEQGDNDADSAETLSFGGPKDFEAVEKSTVASDSMSKEILNGKKMEKPSVSDAYPKGALNAAPVAGNGSISDAVPGTSGPVVKEDWVACDKCQKWRLLPLGTNPDSLPEKWLCSMLNWLPGMNRCSVSEDETTKALIALYHVPAPVNPNNQQGHPGGVLPGLSMADASHFNQNCQIFGLHAVPSGGKKKNGIKDESDLLSLVGPAQFSNSTKKNLQAAVKCRSFNGVNQSPPGNEIETMHLSKSSLVEKRRHKPKEKNKLREQHSDGGDIRSSKIKSKMDNGQDCFRISKKIKIEGMHCSNPERMPDHDAPVGKVGPSSSSGLSVNASVKDSHKYDDRSSEEGKCEANNSSKGHHRNPKDQGQATPDDGSLDMKKLADKDLVARKRKMNEGQDTLVYIPSPLSGHNRHGRRDYLEQTSENVHRKEKKARVSKSEGKETSVSKSSGGAAKKGRRTKDQQLGPDLACSLTQRSLDATDYSRRDLGSVHSQAATSSSSKVSGSRKSTTNMHEMKSSPVESVSSSPLRFLNPDRSTLTRSLQAKDDFGEAGLFGTGTPRRCSAGDDERGSNRSMTVRKDETSVTHRESLESVLDFEERDRGHLAGSEAKIEIVHSAEFGNSHFASGATDTFANGTPYPSKPQASDQSCDEERGNDKQCPANVSRSRKSGKGSSSRSQVKNGSYKPELDKGKVRTTNSGNESIDHAASYGEKSRAGRNGVLEKFGANSDKVVGGNKESAGKVVSERSKSGSQLKSGEIGSLDVKVEAISSKDQMQNLRLDCDERSSKAYLSDKTDRTEVSGRGKSHPLPPSGRGRNETLTQSIPLNPGCQNENGGNSSLHDASEARSKKDASEGDALKAPKQNRKSENQNGNELTRSKHPPINGHKVRDADAPSPARRDSSNPVTNAVKEAKDLKHLADRLKNSGSSSESTGLYFQAALKFLHGASLLESSNGESAKQGEMIQSMQMYSSTAKLCEFCAHEYEKSKDMAAAALAYKCMEVAYMRVIYSSRTSASRDRHELQTALQIVPLGESPSSSASDVDNLNNPATLDKAPLARGVSSPQVAGNHVIATKNRPSFARLLNFTQDVNHAMEASRKSRMAFIAANLRKEEAQYREGITSVKTALDFNFQDVEGLLHLVRLAMEAIGR